MTATLGNDTSSGNYQPMASNDTYELDKGQFSSQPGPQMDTQGYQPIDEDYVAPGEPGYKYDDPTGPLGMNSGRNSGSAGGAAGVLSHPATPAALLAGGGVAAIYGLSQLSKAMRGEAGGGLREDYKKFGFDPDNPPVP